jgi:hypothetical protein
LLDRRPAVGVVADRGRESSAEAEEIEVRIQARDAAAPAIAVIVEAHHSACGAEPGAVLRGQAADDEDVGGLGPAVFQGLHCRFAYRLAKKEGEQARAVADGRLRDNHRNRQEAFPVEQPFGEIEAPVLRVAERPEAFAAVSGRDRQRERKNDAEQPALHVPIIGRPAGSNAGGSETAAPLKIWVFPVTDHAPFPADDDRRYPRAALGRRLRGGRSPPPRSTALRMQRRCSRAKPASARPRSLSRRSLGAN